MIGSDHEKHLASLVHNGRTHSRATTLKTDLEPLSGSRVFGYYARCVKEWVKVSGELTQDRRAWSKVYGSL